MPEFNLRLVAITTLLTLIATFVCPGAVLAHGPHDVIGALAISPAYTQDQTMFVFVPLMGLQKSTDSGQSWQPLANGLDAREEVTTIVISPDFQDDRTVFVATNGDGIYRSSNGGDSWHKINTGLDNLSINHLAISPNFRADRTLLAASSQGTLFKTGDAGQQWFPVLGNWTIVTSIAFFADGQTILLGDQNGAIHRSIDGGDQWQQQIYLPNAGVVTALVISPDAAGDGIWFVGTSQGGIFKTTDYGLSYRQVNSGLSDLSLIFQGKYGTYKERFKSIRSLAISPEFKKDATLFVSTWYEAIYQSTDGGQSWELHDTGLTRTPQADEPGYMAPHFTNLYLSPGFELDQTMFLAGFDGLFKSTNGGHSWTELETIPPDLITGLALSPHLPGGASVALTSAGGAYSAPEPADDWSVNNIGLIKVGLMDIDFSPNYQLDHTLFSSSEEHVVMSTDGGKEWHLINFTLYNESETAVRIKTRLQGLLRRVGLPRPKFLQVPRPYPDLIAVSPNYTADQTLFIGTRYNGLYRSQGDTQTWVNIWPDKRVSGLVISPEFAADRTLFAADRDQGVFKSIDGGNSWSAANEGLGFVASEQRQSSRSQVRQNIELTISPNFGEDQTVFANSAEGLFKTINSGQTWQSLDGLVQGTESIEAVALSPNYSQDTTLLVSVSGRGLLKSEDGGQTFYAVGADLIAANASLERIVFSPAYRENQTIYGATSKQLFRSIDGGQTWQLVARPIRLEDNLKLVQFSGDWETEADSKASAAYFSFSETGGSKATLNFVGSGITWLGSVGPDHGQAKVYIDGQFKAEVDQFSPGKEALVASYTMTGLDQGAHTIVVEVSPTKGANANGGRITIDAFDVLSGAQD